MGDVTFPASGFKPPAPSALVAFKRILFKTEQERERENEVGRRRAVENNRILVVLLLLFSLYISIIARTYICRVFVFECVLFCF